MKKNLLIILLMTAFNSKAQCWKSVSVGQQHAVGIQTNGTLWSWGRGDNGALGNGSDWSAPAPEQIGTASSWSKVHSGDWHSFAIKDNGTLWGWGSNYYGNLGIGSSVTHSSIPVQVGTSQWKMISAGGGHSVGIKSDGTLWSWGKNQYFQLGDNTQINRSVPVLINSSTNWKMVSCSNFRTIAVKEDGTIWVWGSNSVNLGVVGMYSDTPFITTPMQVGTDTDWDFVTAGSGALLAIKTNKKLYGWGSGGSGALGNGIVFPGVLVPTQIGASDWDFIDAESQTSFGIHSDGTLWAWGRNMWGNLGNGNQTDLLYPTQITTYSDWKSVASSHNFTAGIKTDGSLYTWGTNWHGNLGNGSFEMEQYVFTPAVINTCALNTVAFNKNKINVYPNPVLNSLFIATDEFQSYKMYSILGSKISEGNLSVGNNIDCSSLTSGVYLLNLVDNSGNSTTLKFVKQ